MKCFKCGAAIEKGISGNLIYNCDCFPKSTIEYVSGDIWSAMASAATAVPYPLTGAPDALQYCQNCGAPMLQPEHTCRKVKAVLTSEAIQDALRPKQRDDLTPAMAERMDIMREDARIEAEAEYKQAMQKCIEHLKTCSTCKYLSQVDGSICPDMVKLRSMRDIRFAEEEKVQI